MNHSVSTKNSEGLSSAGAVPSVHGAVFPFKLFKLSNDHVNAVCAATTFDEAETFFDANLEDVERRHSRAREIAYGELDPSFWDWVARKWSGTPILVAYLQGNFDDQHMSQLARPVPSWSGASHKQADEAESQISFAVRRQFGEARREAMRTQGRVTMKRVRANQATMKCLP
ncbi:MAG: hypothetical protein K8R87_09185 [Verrucomicrobia bacterium]|nr:hypothetical protein [Verrucomicrobiota bacterium]